MKFSQLLHVASIGLGAAGIVTALAGVQAGSAGTVWNLSREHLFLCSGLLMLIAIWTVVGAIHHLLLEKQGRVL